MIMGEGNAVPREEGGNRVRRARISKASIKRLTAYLRTVRQLAAQGVRMATSGDLARHVGYSEQIIRKDLSQFGTFGTKGMGYELSTLSTGIERALGFDRRPGAVLVGAGHLGTALLRHCQARPGPVRVVAALDRDQGKVGRQIGDVRVLPLRDLERVIRDLGVSVAIVAVPGSEARTVADKLQAAGIKAILNFAPVRLAGSRRCHVENIDLAVAMESLAYYVSWRGGERVGERDAREQASGGYGVGRGLLRVGTDSQW